MAKKQKKAEVPRLVVESKVKEYAKSLSEVNVSGDFVDALSEKVGEMISGAVSRCEGNNRKTIRPVDL
jgi:histone H3/H4